MEFEILTTALKANESIPLSHEGVLIKTTEPLWEKGKINWDPRTNTSFHPAAFQVGQKPSAPLDVTLQSDHWETGKTYRLTGVYTGDYSGCPLQFSGSRRITGKDKREILRQVGHTHQKVHQAQPALHGEQGVVRSVVYNCFHRNPPRYDFYTKAAHFVDIDATNTTITLCLYEYLADIREPDSLCNCFDQASLIQVYLEAIGFSQVQFCFMKPFGYLRLTGLVGRGRSNSPGSGSEPYPWDLPVL